MAKQIGRGKLKGAVISVLESSDTALEGRFVVEKASEELGTQVALESVIVVLNRLVQAGWVIRLGARGRRKYIWRPPEPLKHPDRESEAHEQPSNEPLPRALLPDDEDEPDDPDDVPRTRYGDWPPEADRASALDA